MTTFTTFNRVYLSTVHAVIRKRFPAIRPMRDAWVIKSGFGQWEFHGPDKFYTHFRAEDAYHARAKGWEAWLARKDEDDERDVASAMGRIV